MNSKNPAPTAVMPTYARAPLEFVRGEGVWLETATGERYLDFGGGIAVTALGHANPKLVAALNAQAGALWHTSNLYRIPAQEKLAHTLCEHSFADFVFFTNSGTEAMEGCVKAARKYHFDKGAPEKVEIITFDGSFHGRSLGMISAAGGEKLTKGFGPLLPGFVHLPMADLDLVAEAISDQTAAIMIEPIQGEGGIIPFADSFLRGLRDLCDAHGLLLILDEIQCGMGRTGKLFAHEWAGITPDLMGIAKGIGGGFPLGAFMGTSEAVSGMVPGTHGSTYGGNPLACAVGQAVMEEVTAGGFLDRVSQASGRLRQGLEALIAAYPNIFKSVRGQGLMLGLECVLPNLDVVQAGYDAGFLSVPGGGNVVRLLPALNISDAEISEGLARLEQIAAALSAASSDAAL